MWVGEITGRHTLVTVVISLLPVWCILLCGHRHTHSSEQQRQCCSWNVIRFVYERKRKAIFVFIVSQRSYLDICCCRRLSVFGRRCAQSMQLTSCVCVCVCVCVRSFRCCPRSLVPVTHSRRLAGLFCLAATDVTLLNITCWSHTRMQCLFAIKWTYHAVLTQSTNILTWQMPLVSLKKHLNHDCCWISQKKRILFQCNLKKSYPWFSCLFVFISALLGPYVMSVLFLLLFDLQCSFGLSDMLRFLNLKTCKSWINPAIASLLFFSSSEHQIQVLFVICYFSNLILYNNNSNKKNSIIIIIVLSS